MVKDFYGEWNFTIVKFHHFSPLETAIWFSVLIFSTFIANHRKDLERSDYDPSGASRGLIFYALLLLNEHIIRIIWAFKIFCQKGQGLVLPNP